MKSWRERLTAIGLHEDALDLAARSFERVATAFESRYGDAAGARAWWVPGRIEVLGKHTDYGGGRSLLGAVERGFHVIAAPNHDGVVRMMDAASQNGVIIPMQADAEPRPRQWANYPVSVVRRVTRDFPDAHTGMNLVMHSSLPSASGLSSSTALVITTFLPLAEFNLLHAMPAWSAQITDGDALAEYLGAVENGRAYRGFAADHGVGTQGGAEDQTAILRSRPDELRQYHFIPVQHEATVAMPAGWVFAIAMSGVHAAKGAAVRDRYNALAQQLTRLLAIWHDRSGRDDRSLFQALNSASDALERLVEWIPASERTALESRARQFHEECFRTIPAVAGALAAGLPEQIDAPVLTSQRGAETILGNQIPETMHLVESARRDGAAAASAFGAGFGGSVWALVREPDVSRFLREWRNDYLSAYPAHRKRSLFFASHPGPGATPV